MDNNGLRVAMAIGPDLRQVTYAIDKRIVRRHLAIIQQANNLAKMIVQQLCLFAIIETIAHA